MFYVDFVNNCKVFSNFALANLRRAGFVGCQSGYKEGALHYGMRR